MAEAFPNQVPFDDSPAGSSASENDPQTPEMSPMIRSIFYPDELQKDALGLSPSAFNVFKRNGAFTEEPTVTSRKTLKEPNDSFGEGKARKGLNFQDEEEKEQSTQNNGSEHISAQVLSQSEQLGKAETEILTLKETLAKFEAEKEAVLLQYQQSLEKSSALESEVSSAHKDSKGFSQRASQAEAEVQTLKEALSKLQSERDASVLQYQQCMEMISKLEDEVSHARKDAGELNERASKTEVEAKAIRQDLVTVETEKEAAHAQYNQCLEIISNLEEKLLHAEENARMTSERADKAETKVEILRQELARLTEEKEAAALQYLQCLETIADLKHKISYAQEEAQRLTCEIDDGVVKLKGAEERCFLLEKSNQTLQSELQSLVEKMGSQSEELTEKQKELGRLWSCIQEERLRFVEAETAFQTLQHLHAESQEELRSLGEELQNRTQILKEMETCNQGLEDEVQRAKEENKSLNELNLSSVVSIKNLQDEILSLRETIRKLEEEVELRVDQRNALQQEIYCLREELNELNKKHLTVMDQVESVGYDSECFGSSVKDLQVENSKLKEMCEAESSDKVLLLEKLEIMEKLLEKNVVLENSLSDLHVELEGVKEKVKTLEESCQTLLGDKSALVDEKATLISQLQSTAANLEKLSEKNNFLENSLFDANAELEVLRIKSESLEDSYMLLDMEKSGLVTERESLFSQLDVTKQRLEDLEKSFSELEHKHSDLENERECSLRKVEELQASLDAAQQEHASFSSSSEKRLASMELQIHVLEEEGQCRKKEYEEQQDKTFSAQIEIFILQKSVHDLEKKIVSLLIECQNLLEASKLSGKLISELEHENLEQQVKLKSLFGQMKNLRMGLYQVLKTLEIDADHMFENKINQDEALLRHILSKLQETQNSISRSYDENQQLLIEKSVLVTLLGQLKVDAVNVVTERDNLAGEFKIRSEQFSELQMEIQNLLGMNEKWRLKVMEGDHRIEELITETENMRGQLMDLQRANQNLQEDYFKVLGEKKSVMKEAFDLVGEKSDLEEANWVLFGEIMSQCNISLIFNNMVTEKFAELKELTEELDKLRCINNDLEEKERLMVGKLEDVQTENLNLKESLNESENEFASLKSISDQLRFEIAHGKDLLSRKENELLEAEQIFGATANEKRQLHKLVEDLKDKYDEAKLIIKDQEKQILKLSANNDDQSKEMGCVREVNQKLESDLCRLCEELRSATIREESLNSEMRKGTEEIKLWESQAAAFFAELQISSVREVLFEGRIHDLAIACESLENRSNCKDTEIVLLKERVSTLEGEKEGLEESLNSEMRKGTEEIKLWESQAAAFFSELQISSVCEVLFEGRIHELTIACEGLENRSNCKDREIELLKERVSTLEGEKEGLEESLNSEMRKGTEEIKLWESHAAAFFSELQISSVREVLFEGRIHELTIACEGLENRSNCKDTEIELLKEGVSTLEGEKEGLEESLNSEMQKGTEEIKLWESQAAAFFAELQISSVREVLFEGRIHELTIACESLENRSNCKDTEIELLKERVSTLEGENRGLQAHLAAYTPAVISVKHSVSSLEKHTLFHSRLSAVENEKAKDVLLVTRPHAEIYQHMDENGITMVPDEFSDLQDLQRRVEAIEKAVVEMERLAMLEQLNANGKLEAAMREIEELKLQSHSRQENVQARKHVTPHQPEGKRVHDNGPSQGMQTREVSDARNEVLTKDIMLDQISECSSYGISRRETAEADQMLELWETTDRDGSIDPMVGKGQKGATAQPHNQIEPVKEHKPARTPSESLLEKELAVDKLEISGRLTEPRQRGNKRKILERLDSDAQKLTNLQITVEDLKRKVENTEKSRKDKGVQCDTIKGQLGEAEESITKLFDVNRKLIKTVESSSLSFDGVSALDSDESVNARRKFSDEAQRGSEKIGQLQLEVQKVQFLLLKLDDEKETQGKTRITDRKPEVLLRDYLYGGLRTNQKRKKTTFCACVRPPTNGD
ncbi:hypothetical protein I3760_07G087600 [Carya illinoinensis]|nr:hypothetical protein I3760_07G087600 [Carya illinoinensis]